MGYGARIKAPNLFLLLPRLGRRTYCFHLKQQNLPREYKEYYGLKRNNSFATIQRFRDRWNCFLM